MSADFNTVAVLTANPALSGILSVVLANHPQLRVRTFESPMALAIYMRITPVDVLVCDFDGDRLRADTLAEELRNDVEIANRDFQIMALTSIIDQYTKYYAAKSGIDEVIVKPMSPRYLLERVLSRLNAPVMYRKYPSSYHGPDRRLRVPFPATPAPDDKPKGGDNVIPLFKKPSIH